MIHWYNSNANRAYPFTDMAEGRNIIVDLAITLPTELDLVVTSLKSTEEYMSIAIGTATQAVFTLTVAHGREYSTYSMYSLLPGAVGLITLGQPAVVYTGQDIPVDPATIRVLNRNIQNIQQQAKDSKHTGDITIVGGTGVEVVTEGNVITISATNSKQAELTPPCDIVAGLTACGEPLIRSINNVFPDSEGLIHLEVDNA